MKVSASTVFTEIVQSLELELSLLRFSMLSFICLDFNHIDVATELDLPVDVEDEVVVVREDLEIGGNCNEEDEDDDVVKFDEEVELDISFFMRTIAGQLGALFFTTTEVDFDIVLIHNFADTIKYFNELWSP